MTVYGIVITFLLVFPWLLVGVVIVGATASAVRHRLDHLERAWRIRRLGKSVLSPAHGRSREHPAGSRAADHSSAARQTFGMRKAA